MTPSVPHRARCGLGQCRDTFGGQIPTSAPQGLLRMGFKPMGCAGLPGLGFFSGYFLGIPSFVNSPGLMIKACLETRPNQVNSGICPFFLFFLLLTSINSLQAELNYPVQTRNVGFVFNFIKSAPLGLCQFTPVRMCSEPSKNLLAPKCKHISC